MKVLQVNKFNFIKGGADKYFLDLSAWLAATGEFTVAKFCMDHPDNWPDPFKDYFVSQVNYSSRLWRQRWRAAWRMLWSREAADKFAALVNDFQPDIVHVHNLYHQISPSILPVAKRHGLPVILHAHDYKLVCPNYKMFSNGKIDESCRGGHFWRCIPTACVKDSYVFSAWTALEMYLHHNWLKVYEHHVDKVVAPSNFLKNKLVQWGWPAQQITVIPHGLDMSKFHPYYGLGDYWLYFGRLESEKGVDLLLAAMSQLRDRRLKLKIVGAGSEHRHLLDLAKSLGDRVEFVGPKYGEDLAKLIRGAYGVIVPSRWYEVFGLVNLEAAAFGKLVIAADIGGIGEVVKHGQSGLLFKPNSVDDLATKLDWCAANPKQVGEFAREARNYVEREFSRRRHLEAIKNLYRQLIKSDRH